MQAQAMTMMQGSCDWYTPNIKKYSCIETKRKAKKVNHIESSNLSPTAN
jgi:hypothetical protein